MAELENATEFARRRIRQVFTYLRELHRIRTPIPRQVGDEPWHLWLDNPPRHPAVRLGFLPPSREGETPDEREIESGMLLSVRRPRLAPSPEPPPGLETWIDGDWNTPFGTLRTLAERVTEGPDGTRVTTSWSEQRELHSAHARWLETWNAWAAKERPAWEARRLYDSLYGLHSRLQREGDELELLLADGILIWRLPTGGICHPLLLQQVELGFDSELPEFSVRETSAPPELALPLLQLAPSISKEVLSEVALKFGDAQLSVSSAESVRSFSTNLVQWIDRKGEYLDSIQSIERDFPVMFRRPVLIARRRLLGMGRALDSVLVDVETRDDFPVPLERVVGFERQPPEVSDGLTTEVEREELLLSREANREQLAAIERFAKSSSLVVQGPPGTGKTHTISLLVGDLLAQGKSVLVTSHTEKALSVIQQQLPEEIRPLCLSILGSDEANRKELQNSVEVIAAKLGENLDALRKKAKRLEGERNRLLTRKREIEAELLAARRAEYEPIALDGQQYSPTEAGKILREADSTESWIPGPALSSEPLPFDHRFLQRLYASNLEIPQGKEAIFSRPVPDSTQLPQPADVAALLDRQKSLEALESRAPESLWSFPAAAEALERIRALHLLVQRDLDELANAEPWKRSLIELSFEGEKSTSAWLSLCDQVESLIRDETRSREIIFSRQPDLGTPGDPSAQLEVLEEIRSHLSRGRRLGKFTLLLKGSRWRDVVNTCTTRARRPTTREDFEALVAAARLRKERARVESRWDAQAPTVGLPRAADLPAGLSPAFRALGPAIRTAVAWAEARWSPIEVQLNEMGLVHGELSRLVPVPLSPTPLLDEACSQLRLLAESLADRERDAELVSLQHRRAEYRRILESASEAHGAVRVLLRALEASDDSSYAQAFGQLTRLRRLQPIAVWRVRALEAIHAVCPSWAQALDQRTGPHGQAIVPGDEVRAWFLRRLEDEVSRSQELSESSRRSELDDVSRKLQGVTTKLIERKAWASQLERAAALPARQALFNWHAVNRKIPKRSTVPGRIESLRREASKYLQDCRRAVPGWILSLARLAQMFDAGNTRFDVAIIDEASQCDIFGLLVYYMADKVLVVGDHEQVSPSAVGEKLEPVQGLIAQYLQGIPGAGLYDGSTSIYDLAQGAAGDLLCLLEHYRSVPEIIQFSNLLSYHGRIRPLRDGSSAKVFPSVVPFAVKLEHAVGGKVNVDEAEAISRLVRGIVTLPEYKGSTIGVISLVGDEQALEIDRRLREALSEEVYSRHKIVCGNSAQFQGDERDVIFLSMVDGPEDGPLRKREQTMFRQRYNVAASRARDQMWVVYSLDPKIDLKPGDLRRRLIEHALDPWASLRLFDELQRKTESEFERAVLARLIEKGYHVHPQHRVGYYRLDFAVECKGRCVALECDGDRYHDVEQLQDDLYRQATLERLGWRFIRIRGSRFYRDPDRVMEEVFGQLSKLGIEPEAALPRGAYEVAEDQRRELLTRIAQALGGGMTPEAELGLGAEVSVAEPPLVVTSREEGAPNEASKAAPEIGPSTEEEEAPAERAVRTPEPSSVQDRERVSQERRKIDRRKRQLDSGDGSRLGELRRGDEPDAEPLPSKESAVWFALAHWAKENQALQPWQRSLAFTIGRYLANGWPLSAKQRSQGSRAYHEASEAGFVPDTSTQARLDLEVDDRPPN